MDANQIITTVQYSRQYQPQGLHVNTHGDVLITDDSNNFIRLINMSYAHRLGENDTYSADDHLSYYSNDDTVSNEDGKYPISIIAGMNPYFSGDNGPADKARLYQPNNVWVDSEGAVYVSDSENYVIRKIATDGIITSVAGIAGRSGAPYNFREESVAVKVKLPYVQGMTGDSEGHIYMSFPQYSSIGVLDTHSGLISLVYWLQPSNNRNDDDFYQDDVYSHGDVSFVIYNVC